MVEEEERPFSPEERKRLRALLENEARIAWMWGSLRVWAGYISASVIGAYAVYQAVQGTFPGIFKRL